MSNVAAANLFFEEDIFALIRKPTYSFQQPYSYLSHQGLRGDKEFSDFSTLFDEALDMMKGFSSCMYRKLLSTNNPIPFGTPIKQVLFLLMPSPSSTNLKIIFLTLSQ